jgi:hypothetical protein
LAMVFLLGSVGDALLGLLILPLIHG